MRDRCKGVDKTSKYIKIMGASVLLLEKSYKYGKAEKGG